ncbi:hypothetical protein, partial [Micromonospora andamanensis]|uniref:hypothetical protein n=1 Tax=Micromonospora andamanensis TaxID=1287068 RepID=UPI00194F8C82
AGRVDVSVAWAAAERVDPREQVAASPGHPLPDGDGDDTAVRANIAARYGVARLLVELLAEASSDPTPAMTALLHALRRLAELLLRRVSQKPLQSAEVAATLVPALWRQAVPAGRRPPTGPGEQTDQVGDVVQGSSGRRDRGRVGQRRGAREGLFLGRYLSYQEPHLARLPASSTLLTCTIRLERAR